MDIRNGYRHDSALRASFNALAEKTFGLNFESWYQNGFWTENYDPHSVVIDGKVVANVSVNRTDFLVDGKRYRVLQLGTVMTDPEYRGRGLSRAIMESIEPELAAADGAYLFGNDNVVEFYPRFGFVPGKEAEYRKKVSFRGESKVQQVRMDNPAAWDRLRKAMEESTFREGCRMVGNPELIFFYVSQFMQDAACYIPHLDAWAVAELEDGVLTVHNIFGPGETTIDAVAGAFGEVKEIRLCFAPGDAAGWESADHHEEDCNFFVRGPFFEDFADRGLRIPSLSHA